MFSVITRFWMLIVSPVNFFGSSFGVFSLCQSRDWSRSSFASPSSEFGMKDFVCVIFRGSASDGLKVSIWSFVIGIEANAVFSWREYGTRNRWRDDTRTMSTAFWVDLIVSSSLNFSILFFLICPPYELVASRFAVLMLHFVQKWISRFDIRCILPLHDWHIISFRFDIIDSTSPLHFMSGHLYSPTSFFSVVLPHFGQICSDVSSPVCFSFSRSVSFSISWFIGVLILSKR